MSQNSPDIWSHRCQKDQSVDRGRQPSQLRALALFFALTLVQNSVGVLLLPLYIATLSPTEFAVLAVVNIVAAVFGSAVNLKLDGAMRALYFDHDADVETARRYLRLAFTGAIVIATIACVALMALGDLVFAALFSHDLSFFPAGALAVATASINASLAVYFVYLRNRLELSALVRWQALIVIGTLGCQTVFVLACQLGLVGVLLGSLIPAMFTLLLVCVVTPDLIDPHLEWRRLLPSLRYSVPLVAVSVAYVLATRLDRLVLERHFTLETLGAYSLLVSVLGIQTIVLGALDGAIRPHLFAEIKAQGGRARRAVEAYQQLFCVAGLMSLSVAVFLGAQVHLITDHTGYRAMQAWLPLGATAFVPVVLARYYSLLHESQRQSLSLTAGVATRLAVLFALLIVLVPRFGVGGALGALLAAETLSAALLRRSAARRLDTPPSLRFVAPAVAIFLVGLWTSLGVAGDSVAAFGALQLCVVIGLLAATNWRALSMLGLRVRAGPLPGSGT